MADEQDADETVKPDIQLPDDYDSEEQFLTGMRREFAQDMSADADNRTEGAEDIQFLIGKQWDEAIKAIREAAKKPTLTVNRLVAFVAQIVGNRRLSDTQIKVVADNNEQKASARIREGLIRNIQKQSYASVAYDKALEGSVSCGIGNFQLIVDWDDDDVFDQSLKIAAINDHFAVVWDRMMTDPTGRDAKRAFVVDTMPNADFKAQWPWATAADLTADMTMRPSVRANGWLAAGDVRVVNYWRMRTRKRTLAMFTDGSIHDITDDLASEDENVVTEVLARVAQRPDDGTPVMREVNKKYAEKYVCTGTDILAGPYQLEISRIPVFRVPGWEVNDGEQKYRWGLIRFLKDPQRLHNYWRSVAAERIMQTPKSTWLAGKAAIAGHEQEFRDSATSDDPLLTWNDDAANKPERLMPPQLENAFMQQSEMSNQDIKDVSNIHEANLGMPSNEVSGAAIMARQRVSDTGTIIYHDNLNMAIEQCGLVCNELIATVYDTPRIIKVVGQDSKQDLQKINDPNDPTSVDITSGRYSVSIVTGPGFATKRMEALASMTSLANAAPQLLSLFADLYVEAQDWPLADEIAKRIRMTMPPGLVSTTDMTPEEQQSVESRAQQQVQTAQQQLLLAIADYQKTQSETAMNSARARSYNAQADAVPVNTTMKQVDTASKASDRELRGSVEAIRAATGN